MKLNKLPSWSALEEHFHRMSPKACKNSANLESFNLKAGPIELDYSYQKIQPEALKLLIDLAIECGMKEKINMLVEGGMVNKSQGLPALHTALRVLNPKPILVNNQDIMPNIISARRQMETITYQIRSGQWLGFTGKPIKNIVNIGMGGSDFGPKMCVNTLAEFASAELNYFFISDTDPKKFSNTIKKIDPETTLFIISSKSFTTYETLYNTQKAIDWIGQHNMSQHFIAVTAHIDKAKEWGISHILPIWEWVGGRYSLCSAINLITCIAIGYDLFMELLAGAHQMDQHFCDAEFHENMPVLLALLGIWNINFLHITSLLLVICAAQLELIVPYIQQLDMESNGKSIDNDGQIIDYSTGPLILGGIGDQMRHSYYQLLVAGNHKIAADFISINEFDDELINSFCASTIHTLNEDISLGDNPLRTPGGIPINHIKLDSCNPFTLGSLIALYEHKIYAQSILWGINSFDQPGVEYAKQINENLNKKYTLHEPGKNS
jgi:glucose-6-phosphate isomerase